MSNENETDPKPALLPCPFCNEEPTLLTLARDGKFVRTTVACESCGFDIGWEEGGGAEVLWNTRDGKS